MNDLLTLAKYPFLSDAKNYVQKEAPTITELLDDALYERARLIAIERLDGAFLKNDVGVRSLSTESDYFMELLSYPIARMITVCIGDSFFTKRYALAEAVRLYRNLLREDITFLLQIAREFDIEFLYDAESEHLSIFFVHYIRFAPTRYKTWKLINREMANGYVTISEKDLSRLLQEALRSRINQELDGKHCHSHVMDVFSEDILRIRNEVMMHRKKIETEPIGTLDIAKLPPCLKDVLAAIQSGENVAHMGRFALVAFFNSLKMTPKDILKVFSTAPDFEEEKTRYQIEHITGATSSTSYIAPGCDKLKTYGLCPSEKIDDICRKANHPLNYYRIKWQKEKRSSQGPGHPKE
jgi:DNA primase large subunit